MKPQKPLIRRTFLQERFMILIEKQQLGEATFDELTELDELINRDPKLRGIILEEMAEESPLSKLPNNDLTNDNKQAESLSLMERIKSLIKSFRIFYKSLQPVTLG
jgi:hypothetical protein